MTGAFWSPCPEGERFGGRRNRAYRITLSIWTFVVVAIDLFLFFALPGRDNSNSFASGMHAFVAITIVFLPLIWVIGYGLIRGIFELID